MGGPKSSSWHILWKILEMFKGRFISLPVCNWWSNQSQLNTLSCGLVVVQPCQIPKIKSLSFVGIPIGSTTQQVKKYQEKTIWLVVSTHLKNISQNGPSRGENKKYLKPPPLWEGRNGQNMRWGMASPNVRRAPGDCRNSPISKNYPPEV